MDSTYLFRAGNTNSIKIGKSCHIDERIVALQVGNDKELIKIDSAECKDSFLLERKLHTLFKEYNIRGEWFNFSNDILQKCVVELHRFANLINLGKYTKQTYADEIVNTPNDIYYKNDENEDIVSICEEGFTSVSNYFVKKHKNTVVSDNSNAYVWSFTTQLWEKKELFAFGTMIITYISNLFDDYIENLPKREQDNVYKIRNKYTSSTSATRLGKWCITLLKNIDFVNSFDTDRNTLNFKNGLYNLETGLFRKRTIDDHVSECLN